MYRAPSDNEADNRKFYQKKYSQGPTTELPSDAEVSRLLAEKFAGHQHCYDAVISLLKALGVGAGRRLFDYGCSWGYGSWQLRQAGLDVLAYEISEPRRDYALNRLGVEMFEGFPDPSNLGALAHSFDCFFSSHVVEHVPRPAAVIELAQAMLRPGGYFVAITPNGSKSFRFAAPQNWHQAWGKVHPNLIDDKFWERALAPLPLLLASSPVDLVQVQAFLEGSANCEAPRLDGGELVCIARF